MKDEKGHGSDAHSGGVQQIGKPKEYSWSPLPHGGHVLSVNGNLADQVGIVTKQMQRDGKNAYVGNYHYIASTGNSPSGYAHHKSVQGAKKYVEEQLGKFWEPPNIRQK